MPLTRKSVYKTVGLAANAGETAIRAAYKILALRYHPDKASKEACTEATSNFQEVQTAYEYCLKSLHYATCEDEPEHSNAAGSDEELKEETVHWRGKLPNGVGG
jgi:DnaJ-class molecular chaperone